MNIPIESVAKAVSKGLTIEEYIVLCITNDGCSYLFNQDYPSLQSISNLVANGYFNSKEEITEKGIKFLEEINGVVSKKIDNKIDFKALNLKLKERLQLSHGSKQTIGFGGVYFIPTVPELQEFLNRFWKNYPEMKDINKIISCLETHIVNCSKKKSFAPAIKYFIFKVGTGSQLANAYENFEEAKKEEESKKEELQPKEIKDLF